MFTDFQISLPLQLPLSPWPNNSTRVKISENITSPKVPVPMWKLVISTSGLAPAFATFLWSVKVFDNSTCIVISLISKYAKICAINNKPSLYNVVHYDKVTAALYYNTGLKEDGSVFYPFNRGQGSYYFTKVNQMSN